MFVLRRMSRSGNKTKKTNTKIAPCDNIDSMSIENVVLVDPVITTCPECIPDYHSRHFRCDAYHMIARCQMQTRLDEIIYQPKIGRPTTIYSPCTVCRKCTETFVDIGTAHLWHCDDRICKEFVTKSVCYYMNTNLTIPVATWFGKYQRGSRPNVSFFRESTRTVTNAQVSLSSVNTIHFDPQADDFTIDIVFCDEGPWNQRRAVISEKVTLGNLFFHTKGLLSKIELETDFLGTSDQAMKIGASDVLLLMKKLRESTDKGISADSGDCSS